VADFSVPEMKESNRLICSLTGDERTSTDGWADLAINATGFILEGNSNKRTPRVFEAVAARCPVSRHCQKLYIKAGQIKVRMPTKCSMED